VRSRHADNRALYTRVRFACSEQGLCFEHADAVSGGLAFYAIIRGFFRGLAIAEEVSRGLRKLGRFASRIFICVVAILHASHGQRE
jgi:hypothetical protein